MATNRLSQQPSNNFNISFRLMDCSISPCEDQWMGEKSGQWVWARQRKTYCYTSLTSIDQPPSPNQLMNHILQLPSHRLPVGVLAMSSIV